VRIAVQADLEDKIALAKRLAGLVDADTARIEQAEDHLARVNALKK